MSNKLTVPELNEIINSDVETVIKQVVFDTPPITIAEFASIIGKELADRIQEAHTVIPNGKLLNYMAGRFASNIVHLLHTGDKVLFLQHPHVQPRADGQFVAVVTFLRLTEDEVSEIQKKLNRSIERGLEVDLHEGIDQNAEV